METTNFTEINSSAYDFDICGCSLIKAAMELTPDEIENSLFPDDVVEFYRLNWRNSIVRFSNTYEAYEIQ
jgi:hypothetical protein